MAKDWFEVLSDEFEASKRRYFELMQTGISKLDPKNLDRVKAETEYKTLSRLRERLFEYK